MNRKMNKTGSWLLNGAPLGAALLMVGCGGGGGSNGTATGPTQNATVGPVAVTFIGHPQSRVSGSSSLVTSVGEAGASFTTISINPTHNPSSTTLASLRDT